MAHTASKTWVSESTKEYEAFVKVRDSLAHIAPKSPFVPRTFAGWIAHRIEVKEEEYNDITSKIALREATRNKSIPGSLRPVLKEKEFGDHRVPVLAMESIWISSEASRPGRPQAPWPSYEELKHEGDDRSRSGYSRFPPLPRDPGNITVNWKQRSPLRQFRFDEVGRPNMAVDSPSNQSDDTTLYLIGQALFSELDK
jgi:hypothetical protein